MGIYTAITSKSVELTRHLCLLPLGPRRLPGGKTRVLLLSRLVCLRRRASLSLVSMVANGLVEFILAALSFAFARFNSLKQRPICCCCRRRRNFHDYLSRREMWVCVFARSYWLNGI